MLSVTFASIEAEVRSVVSADFEALTSICDVFEGLMEEETVFITFLDSAVEDVFELLNLLRPRL